ncbi:MAG TPA: hypothetical protein DDZ99_08630 [Clostridiales bacterium]|nr:hypothetical protein [Clostridiales bacterium]
MNLPYDATERDIKRRFHELEKQYHPDLGGNANKFIELLNTYKKLIKK